MGKRLTILGAGESGIGAARLALKKGCKVFLSDNGQVAERYKEVLWQLGEVEWEEEGHTLERILEADEVIKSPGIPDDVSVIEAVRKAGIPVISEIEFAFRFAKGKILGITGSNGKTTTAMLMHHILEKAGLDVVLAGNIGQSFSGVLAEREYDHYVLEISSFQLDGVRAFRPHIAVLLNITPDHLERYGGKMEGYVASKFRIAENQGGEDAFIYNDDDEVIRQELGKRQTIVAEQYPFSLRHKVGNGAYVQGNTIITNIKKQEEQLMSIFDVALKGQHNTYNTMAASVASRILEIRKEVIRESLSDFQNAEHRLEYVASVHGVTFINDSKATNVNATWYALESADAPVIWIAGGVDKGNDYEALRPIIKDKVKAILCLTKHPKKIHEAFGDLVGTILDTEQAYEAVGYGYQLAEKGDTVLLSPACASFDLFENYEDRGHQFKQAVKAL